MNEHNFWLKFN